LKLIVFWQERALLSLEISESGHADFDFLRYTFDFRKKSSFEVDASSIFVVKNPTEILDGKRLIEHGLLFLKLNMFTLAFRRNHSKYLLRKWLFVQRADRYFKSGRSLEFGRRLGYTGELRR
jgi:hypothetical protein